MRPRPSRKHATWIGRNWYDIPLLSRPCVLWGEIRPSRALARPCNNAMRRLTIGRIDAMNDPLCPRREHSAAHVAGARVAGEAPGLPAERVLRYSALPPLSSLD